MSTMSGSAAPVAPTTRRRRFSFAAAATIALVVGGSSAMPTATATAQAPVTVQCNNDEVTGAAREITCDVAVVNTFDAATGVTSSITTVRECAGAPFALTEGDCTTTPTESTNLVGSVNQCNNSVNDGGSIVTCNVTVINNITGTGSTSPATVNQCIGSGEGGGTQPTIKCDPMTSVTGADITQCNGSASGGGRGGVGLERVQCDASGTVSTLLPVTIVQCNGSANGNGDLVTCSARITTNILAPAQETTTLVTTPNAPGTIVGDTSATTGLVTDTLSVASTSPIPTLPDDTLPRTGSSSASGSTALFAVLMLLGGIGAMRLARRSAPSRG
jgi:hypothetical protein